MGGRQQQEDLQLQVQLGLQSRTDRATQRIRVLKNKASKKERTPETGRAWWWWMPIVPSRRQRLPETAETVGSRTVWSTTVLILGEFQDRQRNIERPCSKQINKQTKRTKFLKL